MAKSKTIRVTPNVQKCLAIFKEVVKTMPEGDLKNRAKRAVSYLDLTFKGKPQPNRGMIGCRPNRAWVG
ncbi:MAG: hypothetical protein WCC06_10095 [Candidatus Aminicenantales bacterium]